MAVARTQHQPVIAEPNRAAVAVDGGVPHIQDGQGCGIPCVGLTNSFEKREARQHGFDAGWVTASASRSCAACNAAGSMVTISIDPG